MNNTNPIGVFDSGVGGLSVLRALLALMPSENILFFGDQGHVPYGPRQISQIRDFSAGITRFLLDEGAKLIVVACNTASAAALTYLRETFPQVKFVGMEPAVKPAAETTHTGVVGVLATPTTFQGALYASVVERFAGNVILLTDTCDGLVQQIEHGDLDGPRTRVILESALGPMLEKNIDTVVLACTHFPFVIPLIQQIVGESVRVIDPAPSVAKQTQRLLEAGRALNAGGRGRVQLFTSGDAGKVESLLPKLLGERGEVSRLEWAGDTRLFRLKGKDGQL